GGTVDLGPSGDHADVRVIGAEPGPSLSGATLLAQRAAADHAALERLPVGVQLAGYRLAESAARGACVAPAVLLLAALTHVHGGAHNGGPGGRASVQVVGEFRVTGGAALHVVTGWR